jgi:hypothetical protein
MTNEMAIWTERYETMTHLRFLFLHLRTCMLYALFDEFS